MYGLDGIVIALPADNRKAPYRVRMKRAGKAVVTEKHNTSISAVIIIRALPNKPPILIVYHNHFARVPLDPNHLRDHVSDQFALRYAENGATTWVDV
jgi:hypothetical protein